MRTQDSNPGAATSAGTSPKETTTSPRFTVLVCRMQRLVPAYQDFWEGRNKESSKRRLGKLHRLGGSGKQLLTSLSCLSLAHLLPSEGPQCLPNKPSFESMTQTFNLCLLALKFQIKLHKGKSSQTFSIISHASTPCNLASVLRNVMKL